MFILDSKSAQTDEEKQRERQRNEREQKNAEIEAANIKVSLIEIVFRRNYKWLFGFELFL